MGQRLHGLDDVLQGADRPVAQRADAFGEAVGAIGPWVRLRAGREELGDRNAEGLGNSLDGHDPGGLFAPLELEDLTRREPRGATELGLAPRLAFPSSRTLVASTCTMVLRRAISRLLKTLSAGRPDG